MDQKIKAVIFDIDGTLSEDISWTKITKELGASVPNHENIYEDFKKGNLSLEEGQKAIVTLWRGKDGILNKDRLLEILNHWILKEDAVSIFTYLKEKNFITCLITGSIDLFAEVIAKRVGADFWFANSKLIWDKNGYLENIIYEPNAGDKKVEQFLEFCKINHLKPGECAIVGDDSNDIQLFEMTKNGIAVKSPTSHVLTSVSWRNVSKLDEIRTILS
jgi:phosphoserine phosphatase